MSIGAYYAEVAVEGLAYHFDAVYSYIIPLDLEKRAMAGCRCLSVTETEKNRDLYCP